MKRFLCAAALLVLVTGCGNASNNTNNDTSNTAGGSSNQTAVGTQNTPSNDTSTGAGGANSTSPAANSTSGSNATQTQNLKVYAKGIVEMYVRTKNAKTLPEYQVMANQIFIPGMANVVGSMARSGVDYNHPLKSYTVHVDSVSPISEQAFSAVVSAHVVFKDGTKQDNHYHVRFLQGGALDYMIQTIS